MIIMVDIELNYIVSSWIYCSIAWKTHILKNEKKIE